MAADDAPIFLARELNSIETEGLRMLDCVGWPCAAPNETAETEDAPARADANIDGETTHETANSADMMELQVVFAHGTSIKRFDPAPSEDYVRFTHAYGVNGALILSGQTEQADTVKISLDEGEINLEVDTPELALFEGLNTSLTEWHDEPLSQLEDWLRYHIDRFHLDAVLLIERARQPARTDKKLEKLAKKLGLKRLVLLRSKLPLGDPEKPPNSDPSFAPDAPHPDRLEPAKPDAQTAPLVNLVLYEALRWRFLNSARAVMNLDLSDLLGPDSDPFSQAQTASAGVVQLQGQRSYPWRVRKGKTPAFGDHICRMINDSPLNRRWCLAPARLDRRHMWRLVRVTGCEITADDTAPFWRAMSLRHPQASIADIAPKSALAEDQTLLGMATVVFDHKPVRPPKAKPAKAARSGSGRSCIVTCMKDEGPFILEWIAYHRAIGVDDFLIYTNDCTDGTTVLLDVLQSRGLVQHRANPFEPGGQKPQHAALTAAQDEPVVQNCSWAISMDVDEFINIHVGQGLLSDLYGAIGDANMISLTWRLFGNADVHSYKDAFVTRQFTRCAPQLIRKPHQAWGFKTLFRNIGLYKKLGVHRPKGLKTELWDQIKWVNGSGKQMPKALLRQGWRSTLDSYGYDLVSLNHYAVRSAESFLVKRDRGRVNHTERDQGLNYWFRMNNNAEEDRTILDKSDRLQTEFDRLMSDPTIAEAHRACVLAHQAKIFKLLGEQNMGPFFAQITSTRMEKLSRWHTHFGNAVFLAGPEVIPDEIVEQDSLDKDFIFSVPQVKPAE